MEILNTVPLFLCFLPLFSHAAIFNSITPGQFIRDGDRVVSHGLNFELGFFGFEDSPQRYVGIWYSLPRQPVIWVGNRENPIENREGAITISKDGNLVILDGKNYTVWSSNVSISIPRNKSSQAILRDDGNLVLLSRANNRKLWQSFEHPTDTFLPGMIVPVNERMGEVRSFVSWKSVHDPSPGNYTMGLDPCAAPQIVIWEGSKRRWRSGYWDGRIFTGVSNMTSSYLYGFRLNVNDDQSRYLTYKPLNNSVKVRFQIVWDGTERELIWDEGERKWITKETEPHNECELYNKCGNFGVCCLSTSPICNCLKGFEPKDWDQWQKGNWSGGCIRKTPLKNEIIASNGTEENVGEDGFLMMKCMKLPDFVTLVADSSNSGIDVTRENCEIHCVSNSDCTAYAYVIGIGCMNWQGELVDVDHFENGGNMLFIRLAASELGNMSKKNKAVIIAAVMAGVICLGLCVWLACIFQRKRHGGKNDDVPIFVTNKSRESSGGVTGSTEFSLEGNQLSGLELPLFNFNCIAIATNNFSEENKLGQGGFGPVYKGKLRGVEEIAVKRLSRCSGQGLEEFKNEMVLIAKLQHRNLVRLLGCSIQEEEKLLVYEYLPNKSLDCYLFDPDEHKRLDWKKRFEIIEGIARGMLYLHRDSRLRIIHRDLKASNILLDENMNPKISDFGLARIFGGNQMEASTNRVVGTYGYMAPEYAMEGLFSVKSDVYSFGVLLLEIVSGSKNTSFRDKDGSSLVGYAWHLWNEERVMELVDPTIRDSTPRRKALRWIQIGMLCVQDCACDRPTMSDVVLMLETETMALTCPKQPLVICLSSEDKHVHVEEPLDASSNGLTITVALGR